MDDFEKGAYEWADNVKSRISIPAEATEVAAVSIAISLKRIADIHGNMADNLIDVLEATRTQMTRIADALEKREGLSLEDVKRIAGQKAAEYAGGR